MPSTKGLDHAVHSLGLKLSGRLCTISAPRRCGSFWRVQLLNSFNRVCRSVISVANVANLLYCERYLKKRNQTISSHQSFFHATTSSYHS